MMNNSCKALIAVIALLGANGASAANTTIVPLTTDFYSFAGGFSENDRLIVNNAGAGDGFESVGFLGWDLSGLAGANVVSATLTMQMYCNAGLTCTGDDPAASMEISVNTVGIDPASVTDGSAVGALLASIGSEEATVVANDPGIYSWDLTSLISSWLSNPMSITGVALTARGDSTGGGLYNNYFYSSIGPAGTMMPTLEITTVVPLPAAAWMMLSAVAGLAGFRRKVG